MKILGVVIARGGSKGLHKKNLLKLGNKSLVEISIDSALKSDYLSKVVVSTDDEDIFKIAKRTGASVPFLRPKELAEDTSSVFDVLKHCVNWLTINEKWKADIVVLLQSTTPFRKAKHIDGVINLLLKNNVSSAMTIVKPDYPPHWMLIKDENSTMKKLIDSNNVFFRRQDTPHVFQPAGSVYALTNKLLFDFNKNLPHDDTLGLEVTQEEAVNIDTLLQYKLAKVLWENTE